MRGLAFEYCAIEEAWGQGQDPPNNSEFKKLGDLQCYCIQRGEAQLWHGSLAMNLYHNIQTDGELMIFEAKKPGRAPNYMLVRPTIPGTVLITVMAFVRRDVICFRGYRMHGNLACLYDHNMENFLRVNDLMREFRQSALTRGYVRTANTLTLVSKGATLEFSRRLLWDIDAAKDCLGKKMDQDGSPAPAFYFADRVAVSFKPRWFLRL